MDQSDCTLGNTLPSTGGEGGDGGMGARLKTETDDWGITCKSACGMLGLQPFLPQEP